MKPNVVETYSGPFSAVELKSGQWVAARKSHKTVTGTTVWEGLDRQQHTRLGTRAQILKACEPYSREQDAAKLAEKGPKVAEVGQDTVTVIETVDFEACELLPGQWVAARRMGREQWVALDRKGKVHEGDTLAIVEACEPYKTAKAAQNRADKGEA